MRRIAENSENFAKKLFKIPKPMRVFIRSNELFSRLPRRAAEPLVAHPDQPLLHVPPAAALAAVHREEEEGADDARAAANLG